MKKHTEQLNIEEVSKIYEKAGSFERAAKIIGCGKSKLQAFCAKHNIKRKYVINHNIFSNITPQNCYWAGFIAADGCVYRNFLKIGLQKRDAGHIDKIYYFIESKNKAKRKGKYAYLEVKSKTIVEDLKKHFNIVPNKSLHLKPPNINNNELIKHFIRGYVDGDGWLYVNRENVIQIGITSGSRKIISWINNMVHSKFNTNSKITEKYSKKYNKYYPTIIYYSENAELILRWLYEGCYDNLCLDRKLNKYTELVKIRDRIKEKKEKLNNEITEMKNLYKSGLIYKEVAEKMNIKYSKVAYHLGKTKDIKIFKGVRAGRK